MHLQHVGISVTCSECGLELPSIPDYYEHCISSHNNSVEEASVKIEKIKNEFYSLPGSETEDESSFWSGGGSKEKEIEEYEKDYLARQGIPTDDEGNPVDLFAGKNLIEKNVLKGAKWTGKNVDLEKLTHKIADWFYEDGFPKVRKEVSSDKMTYTIQAQKGGVLRTLSSSRKVLTVIIRGEPNNFQISVGTGEWGKGIAVAVVLTGVVGAAGLGLNIAYREKVWKTIKQIVHDLENSVTDSSINSSVENSKNNSGGTSQFCIECGKTLLPNAKFCGKCGTKIDT